MATIFDDDFFEPRIQFGKSTDSDAYRSARTLLLSIRNATAALAATTLLAINVSATELSVQPDVLLHAADSRSEPQSPVDLADFDIFDISERILAEVPNAAKERASNWLRSARHTLRSAGGAWVDPHITVSPEQEVVFEWWYGERKLTAYFSEDEALLLRVWGPNIDTEMDEFNPEDEDVFIKAWRWLRT